ncbi:NEL-type E3 ubiquitin ligase domain-containing protein [Pseudomonas sp. MYb118]|uniref:NEL-type E3 ubiquitin ligase domain-containing protein n=1 Tax=Pseudomonas sp. MYb118 TaxID=1848720 RepID=UPI0034CF878B
MLPDAKTIAASTFTDAHRLAALVEHTGDLDKVQVLQKSLPHWLVNADLAVVQALSAALKQSYLTHARASQVLARLKPLDEFCRHALTTTLKNRWKLDVDVERDTLQVVKKEFSGSGLLPLGYDGQVTTSACSLLHAAMLNFTSEEADPAGFLAESTVRIAGKDRSGPDISPAKFAALCRELDLGEHYQRHIKQVLAVPDPATRAAPIGPIPGSVDVRRLKLLDMQVAAHMAVLKKDISDTAYRMLLKAIEQDLPASKAKGLQYEGAPVLWQGLVIHDVNLHGVLVFSKAFIDTDPKARCVVYMPNNPRRPLYEYASLEDLKTYLTLHLKSDSFRKRFARQYLAGHDAVDFFSRFDKDKVLGKLIALRGDSCPGDFLYSDFVTKAEEDARILAVPTRVVDEQQREKILQALLGIGMVLLNAAALFVPVLGEVMLAAAVVEMASEVYEGVEDWTQGERSEALEHLLNVVEGVVQMAAFAAGGKVVGKVLGKGVKEQANWFENFEAVNAADGKAKLWKPDLTPYRQSTALPSDLRPDSQGVYADGDAHSIVMDGATYRVSRNTGGSAWQIEHPTRTNAFKPALEQTLDGGWRHAYEHAHEWPEAGYALGRTNPRLAEHSSDLTALAEITGMTPGRLHQLHESRLKLPQRVNDCAERFKIDSRITGLITAMERGETTNTPYAQEQLQVLPMLPGWPEKRFIEVLDERDVVTARFPRSAPTNDEINCVHVTQAQRDAGQVLDTVIKGLYPKEVEALTGTSSAEAKPELLAKKIASYLKDNRQPLFGRLYEDYDGITSGDLALLREHTPDLPSRVAQEVLDGASGRDRHFLADRKILGSDLAREVRGAQSAIRQDRALAGLHRPYLANADSEKLTLGLMDRVQGWDDDFRLEVRQGSQTGNLLNSVGEADARSRGVIVKTASGYQVTQSNGNVSSTAASDTLTQAILDALPAGQRSRMGLTGNDSVDVATLRSRLGKAGSGDSQHTARLLRGEGDKTARRLFSCVQAAPPAQSRHPRSLVRKVRKIYPLYTDTQASAFLDKAGETPMVQMSRMRELQQQLEAFRKTLYAWRDDIAQMAKLPGKLNDLRISRRQVAHALENCWRRVAPPRWPANQPYTTLALESNPVGPLPALAEQDVAHVRTLKIKNMEASDDVAYFLKSFKKLTRLELDGNKITRLPEALSLMPDLQHLSLNDNQLMLTEHTLRKLANMRGLHTLSLAGNRLGATLDVRKMLDLQGLFLGHTHTTELPLGLERLPYLDMVDLRGNEIRKLPDWLFDTSRRLARTINLRHNPLSSESSAKLKAYRDKTGEGMGFHENDVAVINEQMARDLWMPRSTEHTFVRRNHTWLALKNQPASDGFFRLLAEVGSTADSRYVREDMMRRVWNVFEATGRDAALRDQLLAMAVKSNCADSAATIFSNLEVAVEIDQVVHQSANAHDRAARLIKLGRALFSLDYLDGIAREKVKADPTLDPVEVGLAYRTGLAQRLDLIGQPRHMRYASLGGVKSADLDAAYTRVINGQLSSQLQEYLDGRGFWSDFMREHHGKQFADLVEPFHARMQTAFDDQDKLGAGYRAQADGIMEEMQQAERDLMKRLTQAAITAEEAKTCFALD